MGKIQMPPDSEEEEVRRDRESLGEGSDSSHCELPKGPRVSHHLCGMEEKQWRRRAETSLGTVSLKGPEPGVSSISALFSAVPSRGPSPPPALRSSSVK